MAVDAARSRAGTLAPAAYPAASDHAGDLYGRYRERIYAYCLYRLGSPEEAEDTLQTVFLYAFRALRRGVVPVAEGPWLFTIAKNACLERRRSTQRRRAEVLSDPQVIESATAAAERNGEDGVRLQEVLRLLPDSQRNAFVLREWRGLSYREIAGELGVTVSCVETLIFRARRTLAELLAEGEERSARRPLARALDLGSLGAALKSLLGGGTAAKVAAAAALATGVAVTAGSQGARPTPAAAAAARASTTTIVAPLLAAERAEQADLRAETSGSGATAGSGRAGAEGKAPGETPPGARPEEAAPAGQPAPSSVQEVTEEVEAAAGAAGLPLELDEPLEAPSLGLPLDAPGTTVLPAAPELPAAPDPTSALPALP